MVLLFDVADFDHWEHRLLLVLGDEDSVSVCASDDFTVFRKNELTQKLTGILFNIKLTIKVPHEDRMFLNSNHFASGLEI